MGSALSEECSSSSGVWGAVVTLERSSATVCSLCAMLKATTSTWLEAGAVRTRAKWKSCEGGGDGLGLGLGSRARVEGMAAVRRCVFAVCSLVGGVLGQCRRAVLLGGGATTWLPVRTGKRGVVGCNAAWLTHAVSNAPSLSHAHSS